MYQLFFITLFEPDGVGSNRSLRKEMKFLFELYAYPKIDAGQMSE